LNKPNRTTFLPFSGGFSGIAYKLITFVITLCLLSSCNSTVPEESEAKKEPVSIQILEQADRLFEQRSDLGNLRQAITDLGRARREFVKSYDVQWRLSKYNYFLGRHTDDEKERDKAFAEGVNDGKVAIRMEPERPDGHFWYGANLGEQSNRNPIKAGLSAIDEVKREMNKVIELKPDYELASAFVVLAQVELVTRILGGDPKKAAELLEKSIEIEKFNGDARIQFAEALLALDRDAEAKKQLEYVLQMKPNPSYLPEYEQQVALARKMLDTKF
jgi:tetratricopeptide (TPR) repeat protein